MRGKVLDFLKVHDVKYKENINLSAISPIRIGGRGDIVAYPDEESKLVDLMLFLGKMEISHKIVGRMSNLLPMDENYNGIVVRTDLLKRCELYGNLFTASAGATLISCANILYQNGLSGFERLAGIPGSIGGALVGNAGAFGCEICDTLVDLKVLDINDGTVRNIPRQDCDFSYRHSCLKQGNFVIVSARFLLDRADKEKIRAQMDRCKELRNKTQPKEPSLGSTFKRPDKDTFAAKLIDGCGLKGYRIGGAEISKLHAGFIVNIGGATAKDYIVLSEYAKKCVYEKYKVCLEREVEIMR